MKPGDLVEYAIHDVVWQEDGSHIPVTLSQGEIDGLPPELVAEGGLVPISEEWALAKVLEVTEHPLPIDAAVDAEPDVVVLIEPDDGTPPFPLNAKLVRVAS